mmetsp:Transcript_30392/g.62725  ORF Transcript_30392/g.62725 Transcript_30392/m.62725 type:complete len:113 (+) Transcript_30392:49-387(+)
MIKLQCILFGNELLFVLRRLPLLDAHESASQCSSIFLHIGVRKFSRSSAAIQWSRFTNESSSGNVGRCNNSRRHRKCKSQKIIHDKSSYFLYYRNSQFFKKFRCNKMVEMFR